MGPGMSQIPGAGEDALGSNGRGSAPSGQEGPKKRRRVHKKAEPMKQKQKRRGPPPSIAIPPVSPNMPCSLQYLKLQRQADFLELELDFTQALVQQCTGLKEGQMEQVEKIRGKTLQVATLDEMISEEYAIVSNNTTAQMYVPIMSFVDQDLLEPGVTVLLHNKTGAVVGVMTDEEDPMVSVMRVDKAPRETYADIGGLEEQIKEMQEAVELPLTNPELYEDIGIQPPKGVILYGPPGTGKTLLAKAVANSTSATFLRVTGSELIQKYLGEGPRLVREMFRVAQELAPTIVFIDEIDAVGAKRYDAQSGGEREVQRTMLELLNQLDGFDSRTDVKVIMATNRIEALDPALIRPGRIDRKVEFPLPDTKTRRMIFQIHTKRMTLNSDVDLEELVQAKDDLSGADIKAICTEAGLLALRDRRMKVSMQDFRKAREKVLYKKEEDIPDLYT